MISFSSITVANKIVQNGIQHATMYMCTTEVCPYSFGPQEIKNNFHLLYICYDNDLSLNPIQLLQVSFLYYAWFQRLGLL